MKVLFPQVSYPAFRGTSAVLGDTLVQKPYTPGPFGFIDDLFQKAKGNEIVKRLEITDTAGHKQEAVIIRLLSEEDDILPLGSKVYSLHVNGKKAGGMVLEDKDWEKTTEIHALCVKKFSEGKYKGVGTELLKFAAQHSIDEGFKGKVSLYATNAASPVGFYYKNNFRIEEKYRPDNHFELEALADYALRKDLGADNILNFPNGVRMTLSPKGAKALINGNRLPAHSYSEKLYTKTFSDSSGKSFRADVDFCDLSNNEYASVEDGGYVVQILKKGKRKGKDGEVIPCYSRIASASGVLKKDKSGARFLDVKNITTKELDPLLELALEDELLGAFSEKLHSLGAEYLAV